MKNNRAKKAIRITILGLIGNTLLSLFKLFAGIFGSSSALVADSIHSFSDSFSDIVILWGFQIARKPIDKTHDYGHGKFETLSTIILAIFLFLAGIGILGNGIKNIILVIKGSSLPRPSFMAFVAAWISIIFKEILYQVTYKIGNQIKSDAIVANAWHHRSDALSSVGAMLGVGGAIFLGERWHILDPLAACAVSFFIIKIAINLSSSSLNELLEKSLDEKTEDHIINLVNHINGVKNPHNLKTRKIGNNVAIDIHIEVDKDMTVRQSHKIATLVENKLKKHFGDESFVSVHVEPEGYKRKHQ